MFLHTFRLLFLRTRLLATVALLLAAANLLLPLLLSSSTPDTDPLALFLTYSSGLTRFLLTLFALWASCAALPQEAELHTLPLLLTRPVSRLRIWLGKWLAVVAACALLLLIAALAASFSAVRVARRAPAPSPLLPYAYAPVAPIPPDTSDAETALLARHRAAHGLPPDAPLPPRVLKNAHALAQSFAIEEHMEFQQDVEGTKAMFARERRSRERYNCCVADERKGPVLLLQLLNHRANHL